MNELPEGTESPGMPVPQRLGIIRKSTVQTACDFSLVVLGVENGVGITPVSFSSSFPPVFLAFLYSSFSPYVLACLCHV